MHFKTLLVLLLFFYCQNSINFLLFYFENMEVLHGHDLRSKLCNERFLHILKYSKTCTSVHKYMI